MHGAGCRVQGAGCRVQGAGFKAQVKGGRTHVEHHRLRSELDPRRQSLSKVKSGRAPRGRYIKGNLKRGNQTPMAQDRSTKIISMTQWIRTSRSPIKISLSGGAPRKLVSLASFVNNDQVMGVTPAHNLTIQRPPNVLLEVKSGGAPRRSWSRGTRCGG